MLLLWQRGQKLYIGIALLPLDINLDITHPFLDYIPRALEQKMRGNVQIFLNILKNSF